MANINVRALSLSQNSYERPASWFEALKRYVQETDVSTLDLRDMQLNVSEITSILEFLVDSQITELAFNSLYQFAKSFSRLLVKTKIKKLDVSTHRLTPRDVLCLMKVLKETQITDLDISGSKFDVHDFIPCLLESRLTALKLANCYFLHKDEQALLFFQALRNTSITHLDLEHAFHFSVSPDAFLSLFFELEHTSITHLSLFGCRRLPHDFRRLGDSLRNSKLVDLDLSWNNIQGHEVGDLFLALIGSKITSLKLAGNSVMVECLGVLLEQTQIKSLDLGHAEPSNRNLFSIPDFLRDSSVENLKLNSSRLGDNKGVQLMESLRFSKTTHLDVSSASLGFNSIAALAEIVNDTSITNLNISQNLISVNDLTVLGELLMGSTIKHLDVSISHIGEANHLLVAEFFKKLMNSPVTSLNMVRFAMRRIRAEVYSPCFASTQLTHLNLEKNYIGNGLRTLAADLKFSAITHLDLTDNKINNGSAKALAECLKETKIIDLNLSQNDIKCSGAIALASSLKDSTILSLKLNRNQIETAGMKFLARHVETSFTTVLEVKWNPGNQFLVEVAIWNNRRRVHLLVSFFKQIAPKIRDGAFRFENAVSNTDVDKFLEECLVFYKTVLEHPIVTHIFASEDSVSLSRDEISRLLTDEFPKQFSLFILTTIEGDVSEQVNFLRKVEELNFSRIVELLLINRPAYTINESHGILHPYVYKLLKKYKLPVCNLDIEPHGIEKIIKYFTEFDMEGAADIVSMLKEMSVNINKASSMENFACTVNLARLANGDPTVLKRKRKF